jgi:hypothetical protein
VTNCILWGDTPSEIYNDSSAPQVTHCDVQGGYLGDNNIAANPWFVSCSDFHLQNNPPDQQSPCIDTGDNSAFPPGITTDLDGHPRIIDGDGNGTATVDMGAYEYQN